MEAQRNPLLLARRVVVCLSLAVVGRHAAMAAGAVPDPEAVAQAQRILEVTGVRGGLIVHLGCGDGRVTAALRASDRFVVHGLDRDADAVARARRHIQQVGLCGPVSVAQWQARGLPYADNLVALLVATEPVRVPKEELLRVLAPNGAAYIKEADGQWRKTVRPWPKGMDAWTHWDHGPDHNPVSQDVLVGPPRRLQWTAGPAWSKKHWGPRISAMVAAEGRLFTVQDETPTSLFNVAAKWVLIARDAFSGVVLWRRPLPEWTGRDWGKVARRKSSPEAPEGLVLGLYGELSGGGGVRDGTSVMVAVGDRLFVPLSADAPVSALDAATGEVLRTYEGISPVKEVACVGGLLLIGGRGRIRALEPETGKPRWEVRGSGICASDGRVYLVSPKGQSVVSVALADGRRLWELAFADAIRATGGALPFERARFTGPLQAGAGIVLAMVVEQRKIEAVAISAAEGKPLWRGPFGGEPFRRGSGPFFIDGGIWVLDSGKGLVRVIDPRTGKVQKEVPAPAIRYVGHHARCYRARATRRYILGKERGADFVDLGTGEVFWHNWVRGPCRRGVLPANGLLYAGQHSCRCYTETALHGFWALAPARRDAGRGTGDKGPAPRLERGPAYGANPEPATRNPEPAAWPTYRHDRSRSGASPTPVPHDLTTTWSTTLAKRLSAPVVAGGRAYVAAVDRHTVHALDAETGQVAWQFVAGGRIDSPPTVHGGRVLFGCHDGWVYCLRARDGALAWRFRAAPAARHVGDHGQIASAWPVPGSILVKDNIAYCVAGRSSFLDGGLYVHALDPATGRLLHTRHLDGPWPKPETGTTKETPNRGFVIPGALSDVLVADADHVYLRQLRFDSALETTTDMQPNLYKSPRLRGENRGGDHKYWDNLLEAPRHALFTDPAWFHRSFFQNFPGRRLYATTGLLDDAWHRRMYWAYGQVVGQYMVFRGEMGYAVQVFATSPREMGANAGDGYVVYAGRTAAQERDTKLFALRPDQSTWRIRVPFRPVAMALAGDTLWLAGPPDSPDPDEALAAVEGKRGGLLCAVAAADGRKLAEHKLDSPPVFDGLIAANGRLYLATTGGAVLCWGGKQ